MTTITLDIETLPDMRPGRRDAYIQAARDNFRAPSTLTKEQAAADLGLTDASEIKFTSKDAMLARWAERFRDEKADEVGDAEWRKTSFDGAKGQICCIGLALDDADPFAFYGDSEADVLRIFFSEADKHILRNNLRRPIFVGHNIAGFDLRFIFQRAVINRVPVPVWFPRNARPWDDCINDTMLMWAGNGNRISLANLCDALGIESSNEMDGSMVCDAVMAGRLQEVADYCADDVRITRECWRRIALMPAPELAKRAAEVQTLADVKPEPIPQPVPQKADDGAKITLGQINQRLSPITLSAAGIAQLGIQPAGKERTAVMYLESDVARICDALEAHLQRVRRGEFKEAA